MALQGHPKSLTLATIESACDTSVDVFAVLRLDLSAISLFTDIVLTEQSSSFMMDSSSNNNNICPRYLQGWHDIYR